LSGIFVGAAEIGSIFVGSDAIAEAYLGSTKVFPAGAPPVSSTWDPARKGAGVVLSNGNLTAQCNIGIGGGNGERVAGTLSRDVTTAAHGFQLRPTTIGQFYSIGLARTDADETDGGPLGTQAGEIGFYNFNGFFFYDLSGSSGSGFQSSGSATPGYPGFGVGDHPFCYVEAGSVWFGEATLGWWDVTSGSYKSSKAAATPFITGLTGSWAPANSNGFAGATSEGDAEFGTFSFGLPAGGSVWG